MDEFKDMLAEIRRLDKEYSRLFNENSEGDGLGLTREEVYANLEDKRIVRRCLYDKISELEGYIRAEKES